MTKRITLILSSVGLATLLLLTLIALMASLNAAPVQAAPAQAPPAAPLHQTTTTPTYAISDSVTGGVTYDWVEISGSGTRVYLAGDNWGSAEVDIGFYFPFYDDVYHTFRASTNGYIYFGGNRADGSHTPIFVGSSSAPNNFIAPFGANLYMHSGVSRIYVDRQSTRTVIEFVDVQWCCGLNDPHTFQIILYRDGRILTQYRQIRYVANPNERVVAGIENDDGSDGAAYYQNWFQEDTSLTDGLAVLYDPADSIFGHLILDVLEPPPPDQTWWDDPGQTGTFSVTMLNLTGISDTFELTYSLDISSSVVPDASAWPVGVPISSGQSISNLGTCTFQLTATIPVTAGWWDLATLHITATATSSPTVFSSTAAIIYGVAQRDLSIEKTLVPDEPPAPGGYFRYQITVGNYGNRSAQARNVRVTDTLPLSTTYNADFPRFDPPGNVGTLVMPGFEWDVGNMDANSEAILDVYMHVPTSTLTGTTLLNTAWTTMTGSVERGPFDNNTITHTMVVTERRLIFGVNKGLLYPDDPVGPDQILTYTVRVENDGNVPISGVVVSDVIPLGTTFAGTDWPTSTLLPDNRTLVFTIGALLNGGWNGVEFHVGVSVPATTTIGTWLTNTVQVTTTASLAGFAHAEGDSDSAVVQVTDPRADAWVVKSPEMLGSDPVTPEPGGDYTFWINYGNDGNVTADSVTLTDTLPISYVVLLEAGPAGIAQPDTSTPGLVIWHISDLAPGEDGWTRVRIEIDAHTPPGTQLLNTAEIAAVGGNITPTNDVSAVTITLDAADVTIQKSVEPTGTLEVGDWVTYTVRFANTGAIAADGVRITDVLPSELTNVTWMTASHPIEALIDAPPLLVWRATQPLAPGDDGTITITGQLDPAATWSSQPRLTNRAEIRTATGEEPVNDPNTAQVSNTVALASPYVFKTGPTLALPGELVSYTIEYGNGGLLDAQDVRLTDTLPVSATYVTDTSGLTPITGTGWISWNVGAVASNTTGLTFALVVSVSPDVPAGTPLENSAELASSTYDGDRTDNESVWITSVGFDLSGSYKQVNGTDGLSVGSGTPVTYAIVLTNNGPFSATSVSVSDPIPTDTAYISNSLASASGAYGYDSAGDAITWTGTVSDYGRITVTFQVTVADAGPLPRGTLITNTAFISDGIQTFQASTLVTITGPNLDGSYKSVNNLRPSTGERITYTIVLNNSGEADAIGASLTDDLPDSRVSYNVNDFWASSGSLGSVDPITWTGVVTQGGRVTITLPVQVTAGPGNHFANTTQIDDGTGRVIQRSVTVSTTQPIIQVQKTATPNDVAQGGRVTYTITIINTGDGWAQSARTTDTIQGGTYISSEVTASSGAVDATSSPTITWTGPIGPGSNVTITIPVTITATPGSDVPNVARVNDGYGTVVADSSSVHVYSGPDLSTSSKTVDQNDARTGDTLDYTLIVNNSGETAASFFVSDTLDTGTGFTTFVGSPPGSYGYAAGVITWTGTVNGMSQAQLAFQAVVSASTSGAVTNTARFEGDGDVYTRTASTQILAPAELTATKQVEPTGPVFAGEYLTYTIVMRNVGGDDAQAAFTDTIPAYTDYIVGSALKYLYHPRRPTMEQP